MPSPRVLILPPTAHVYRSLSRQADRVHIALAPFLLDPIDHLPQHGLKDANLPAAILGGRVEPLSSFPLSRSLRSTPPRRSRPRGNDILASGHSIHIP